jgi:hypothetical protein
MNILTFPQEIRCDDWLRTGSSCGLVPLSAGHFFTILIAISFERKLRELII